MLSTFKDSEGKFRFEEKITKTDFKLLKVSFTDPPQATAESQIDWRLARADEKFVSIEQRTMSSA
jgi:hypothetical protein